MVPVVTVVRGGAAVIAVVRVVTRAVGRAVVRRVWEVMVAAASTKMMVVQKAVADGP